MNLWSSGPNCNRRRQCCKENQRRNELDRDVQANRTEDQKREQCDAQDNGQRAVCECSLHVRFMLPQVPNGEH